MRKASLNMRIAGTATTLVLLIAATCPTAVAVSGYPVSGTVSQDGRTVALGYERGVCGPVNAGESVVCTDDAGVGGVHDLPVLTPGTVRVRVSLPVRFVRAGDRSVSAVVRQLDATDATVTFHRHVRAAQSSGIKRLSEFAWVIVERAGKQYRMLFDPLARHGG